MMKGEQSKHTTEKYLIDMSNLSLCCAVVNDECKYQTKIFHINNGDSKKTKEEIKLCRKCFLYVLFICNSIISFL